MKRIAIVVVVLLGVVGASLAVGAGNQIDTLRKAAIDREPEAPAIAQVENNDIRRKRAYPMQPPTIPHKIDGYQVDLKVNRCMACHSRHRTEASQAPMVSVTHFMDRDGNFLAEISARRYFCQQCHVPQTNARPLLANDFHDIDDLLRASQSPSQQH
ncbi:nitrate reductase cytochrome c-type subunit [Parahaliea aestuarii]|uniref:Periplasmic nitrate reductase, electron transfer subunit n=1 Tax=Parahaliea aestuarii TaxID=1852021 RepID=A0A5C9A0L4_9GAMM|nr:nitrate reductase cytochrome c-type subunit [Parahaliea aestuarii]TXS94405.1 nitrate reductase cytochrome c-type subunit [Parahaliea aestuarii]